MLLPSSADTSGVLGDQRCERAGTACRGAAGPTPVPVVLAPRPLREFDEPHARRPSAPTDPLKTPSGQLQAGTGPVRPSGPGRRVPERCMASGPWRHRHAVRHSRHKRGHLHRWKMASELVGDTGFEPVTSSVSKICRSWRDQRKRKTPQVSPRRSAQARATERRSAPSGAPRCSPFAPLPSRADGG
jgi:hypothetical protein